MLIDMESHITHIFGITSVLLIIFQEEGLIQKSNKIIKYKLTFQLTNNN